MNKTENKKARKLLFYRLFNSCRGDLTRTDDPLHPMQ